MKKVLSFLCIGALTIGLLGCSKKNNEIKSNSMSMTGKASIQEEHLKSDEVNKDIIVLSTLINTGSSLILVNLKQFKRDINCNLYPLIFIQT
jgi:hypothetical protein